MIHTDGRPTICHRGNAVDVMMSRPKANKPRAELVAMLEEYERRYGPLDTQARDESGYPGEEGLISIGGWRYAPGRRDEPTT